VGECQTVYAMMALEVSVAVIEKCSDGSSLAIVSYTAKVQERNHTLEPWVSSTRTKPSNLPTVYMLDVPIRAPPSFAYHIWRFPLPLSGPVARNSTSAVHSWKDGLQLSTNF
jgi:hypothetical protein